MKKEQVIKYLKNKIKYLNFKLNNEEYPSTLDLLCDIQQLRNTIILLKGENK